MNHLFRNLKNIATNAVIPIEHSIVSCISQRFKNSLARMHRLNVKAKENPPSTTKKSPLDGKPFAKGVILKTLVKKPRKPNSANRKCVLVRLSTGKEMTAYVPGVGHNLQARQMIL